MAVMRYIGLIAALAVGACASGPVHQEYGEEALPIEHFDALDSVVAQHVGAAVQVVGQSDVGANGRISTSRVSQVTFSGTLLTSTPGYLRLLTRGADTAFIGKGSVVGLYLSVGDRASVIPGAVLGAVLAAAGAFVITSDISNNVSSTSKRTAISLAALVGAGLGVLLTRDEDRGEQIYPVPPPRSRPR